MVLISNEERFTLYGGPEPENMHENTKSLGEFIIKRLTQNGDKVALVSFDCICVLFKFHS